MLNQTPLLRETQDTVLEGTLVGPTSVLLKFLVGLLLVSGLTCIYLWQASEIPSIEWKTQDLEVRTGAEVQKNVALMLQVAQWNSPSWIESKASTQGMVPSDQPIHVTLSPSSSGVRAMGQRTVAETVWEGITAWMPETIRTAMLQ